MLSKLLLRPTYMVETVMDLDLDELWDAGLRGFIFDLDNTIMAPRTALLEPAVAEWLMAAQQKGFKMAVVSNNPIKWYTQEAEKILQLPVYGSAGKPRRKHLARAIDDHLGLPVEQVAVVGDRPLTDIWGGHRLGSKTILVDPLAKAKEGPFIVFLRWLEHLVIHPECKLKARQKAQ